MSDFTDFLAAMAIEDAMEEDNDSSSKNASKRPSDVSNTETSPGCIFSCCCIAIAFILGFLFDSFIWVIGVAVIGIIIGVAYDVKKMASRSKHEKKNSLS